MQKLYAIVDLETTGGRASRDKVIEIAIVRPGPIQGDMVHPYLRRKQGLEAVTYPSEAIKSVLERTLGVPIFQEQVLRLAMVAAGFSGGEADQLRRAITNWGRNSKLLTFEQKLTKGMIERGYDEDFARRLFEQIKGFALTTSKLTFGGEFAEVWAQARSNIRDIGQVL